jgi:NhaP-type Na+/H+ and K+/H+ antiporter
MVAVWMLFALMVYVLEPLVIHRLFHEFALRNKDRAFAMAIGLHAVALIISAFAVGAGNVNCSVSAGRGC